MTRKEWWEKYKAGEDQALLVEVAANLLGPRKCAAINCANTHFLEPGPASMNLPCPSCDAKLRRTM